RYTANPDQCADCRGGRADRALTGWRPGRYLSRDVLGAVCGATDSSARNRYPYRPGQDLLASPGVLAPTGMGPGPPGGARAHAGAGPRPFPLPPQPPRTLAIFLPTPNSPHPSPRPT